ncbi:DEAD/DEAH box helicase family protein [Salinicoccus hispanicus]|uniref:DEAD/DEAH box helicase family protein n=1 Tax=Salinicoccus hispanicus TaxID=157225 RepID=A0A6N8TYA0_9STAP|nr:DEAD/DEAH box helicase family protein [Salinicoccus hispanicus]MXQ50730.1 DEAD/DEAH box helicase family protein [Salinicoccus hispanicus]
MILDHRGDTIYKTAGVDAEVPLCHRCGNSSKKHFYSYDSPLDGKRVTYCMKCVSLGRSDSMKPIRCRPTSRRKSASPYHLDFDLSSQQAYASDRIMKALRSGRSLLLYAVTGAGKTEMTFQSIEWARSEGLNVAFISPRIDVVKEVHLRLGQAFASSDIDLMYDGVKHVHNNHFTVCTVHQLFNFIDHFDFIIVDETDAFPLPEDPILMQAIRRASTSKATLIFMTATPSRQLIQEVGEEGVITLPRRYHGQDLAIPKMVWHDIRRDLNRGRAPQKLMKLIRDIIEAGRYVLIFIPEISMMETLLKVVREVYPASASVYSGDPERTSKVEQMRNKEIRVLLSTTILERGVTFDRLDAIIVHAEMFNTESLIQMCGRVGRKQTDPVGNIWFFAHYQTSAIRRTFRTIRGFNAARVDT